MRQVKCALSQPWEVAFGPDNRLWVTESRAYRVLRIDPTTGATQVALDAFNKKNWGWNQFPWPQGGFTGLALHPQLLSGKPYVYLAYVYRFDGCGTGNTNCRFKTKVVRYTYNIVSGILTNEEVLVDTIPGSDDHNGGRLAIGSVAGAPFLFYTVGDMGAGQFSNATRPHNAQNTSSYEGKVLRFNLEPDTDAGAFDRWIPASNPFNIPARQSAVWSIGHRNPQGLAFGSNGLLYETEHGPYSDDELNIIEPTKNYGFPRIAGLDDGNYNGLKVGTGPTLPLMNEQASVASLGAAYRNPLKSFVPAPASEVAAIFNNQVAGTDPYPNYFLHWPSIAPSGIEFYGSMSIPGWQNSILITSLKRATVFRVKLSPDGQSAMGDTIGYFRGLGRFRDLAISPDGKKIYVACDSLGQTSGPTLGSALVPQNRGCILEFEYTPPVPCAIAAAVSGVQCSDNGTPAISGDDTWTFNVTVSGTGACGATWSGSGQTGAYGVPKTFGPFPIAGGNKALTFNDVNNPAATATVTAVAPSACSPLACAIEASAANIVCLDNGTPNVGTDDRYKFTLNTVGSNTSANWTSVIGGQSLNFPFGFAAEINNLKIADGPLLVTVADALKVGCVDTFTLVPPAPCSANASSIDLSLSATAPNASPLAFSNFTLAFTVRNNATTGQATGLKVGVIVPAGIVFQNSVYAATQGSFSYGAPGGDVWTLGSLAPGAAATLTLNLFNMNSNAKAVYGQIKSADQADPDSQPGNGTPPTVAQDDEAVVIINPSAPCSISATVSNTACNDNGTPATPADDTYTFDVLVQKSGNCGVAWSGGGQTGAYGTSKKFGPFLISGGSKTLTFNDITNSNITASITAVPPAPCSSAPAGHVDLEITASATDPQVPIYSNVSATFNLKNAGTQTASNVRVRVLTPVNLVFQSTVFTASQGNFVYTGLGDDSWDLGSLAPGATAVLTLHYFNLSADEKTVFAQVQSLDQNNDPDSQPGNGAAPNALQDDETALVFNRNQQMCSIAAALSNLQCSDNGTPATPGDDSFSFDVVLSSLGPCGTTWSGGGATGVYGVTKKFGPFPISGGNKTLVFNDVSNPSASTSVTAAAPAPCSSQPPPGTCLGNLLSNPGFEEGPGGWSGFFEITPDAASGTKAARICSQSYNSFFKTLPVQAGATYTLRANAKRSGTTANQPIFIGLISLTSTFQPITLTTAQVTTTAWQTYSVSFAPEPNAAYIEVIANKEAGPDCLLADDFCLTAGPGSGVLPDLQLANFNIATSGQAGQQINFNVDIKNAGAVPASGNYAVGAYLSTDNILSNNDLQVGFINTGNTPVGTQPQILSAITLPNNQATGNYFLILKIDRDNAISESNEQNNLVSKPFAVTVPTLSSKPDLLLNLFASPGSPGQWKNVALTLEVKNLGSAPSTGVTVAFPAQSDANFSSKLAYVSHSASPGTDFNYWTGVWTVGTVLPGEVKTLVYNGFARVSTTIAVFAQVLAAATPDFDSAPGNNSTGTPSEDDEARTTVNAGQMLAGDLRQIEPIKAENVSDFSIFPNPAGESATLDLERWLHRSARLTFYNQLGVKVLSFDLAPLETPLLPIDLSVFSNGQYFLKMESAGERAVFRKLVVARMY